MTAILRPGPVPGTLRCAIALLMTISIVLSIAAPAQISVDALQRQQEPRIVGAGRIAGLPFLNERHERPELSTARCAHITLPVEVLENGPVVHGVVILPARNDARLSSHLVYTQTTSSRL